MADRPPAGWKSVWKTNIGSFFKNKLAPKNKSGHRLEKVLDIGWKIKILYVGRVCKKDPFRGRSTRGRRQSRTPYIHYREWVNGSIGSEARQGRAKKIFRGSMADRPAAENLYGKPTSDLFSKIKFG
jgi:hypothetical protein